MECVATADEDECPPVPDRDVTDTQIHALRRLLEVRSVYCYQLAVLPYTLVMILHVDYLCKQ